MTLQNCRSLACCPPTSPTPPPPPPAPPTPPAFAAANFAVIAALATSGRRRIPPPRRADLSHDDRITRRRLCHVDGTIFAPIGMPRHLERGASSPPTASSTSIKPGAAANYQHTNDTPPSGGSCALQE